MKLPNLLLIMVIFISSSCDDNIPGNEVGKKSELDISFKLTYGGEELIFGDEYLYLGRSIVFNKFSFFLSNLTLTKDDDISNKIEVSEINFIDFANNSTSRVSLKNIPVSSYQGLSFNIGVSADFNRSVPADFGRNHPLNDTTMYKVDWESYLFSKLSGTYDSSVDFNYVTGKNESFHSYSVTKAFPINVGNKTVLEFEIAVDKIFGTSATTLIDIEKNPTTITDGSNELMQLIMNNFATKAINCL